MNELFNKTISQIVTEYHQTAPVFEKYSIAFCCNGKRLLIDACAEKELSKEDVVAELEQAIQTASAETDFTKLSLAGLADYIVREHHSYVKFNMPHILQYIATVATKHGDRFPFMKDVYLLFAEVQNEMTQHMLKEERILFPRIKQLEQNALVLDDINYFQGPIDVMIEDHDLAGNLLQQIRKLTNDYTAPEGACTTFRLSLASLQAFEGDLHRHVHVENHVLFPRTIALYQKLAKSTAC